VQFLHREEIMKENNNRKIVKIKKKSKRPLSKKEIKQVFGGVGGEREDLNALDGAKAGGVT
jgi:hypothetical protein